MRSQHFLPCFRALSAAALSAQSLGSLPACAVNDFEVAVQRFNCEANNTKRICDNPQIISQVSSASSMSTAVIPSTTTTEAMSGLPFTHMVTTNGTMVTTTFTFNGTISATLFRFAGSSAEAGLEFGGFGLYGAITAIGVMTVLFAEF